MNVSPNARQLDSPNGSAVARIDAQDVRTAEPFGEYLSAHGCEVFVNPSYAMVMSYHFIFGDDLFVKEIFSAVHQADEKRFVVLLGEPSDDPSLIAKQYNAKVVVVAGKTLDAREVNSLFAFFFASDQRVYLREALQSWQLTKKPSDSSGRESREQKQIRGAETKNTDRERIEQTIADVFGKEPRAPSGPRTRTEFPKSQRRRVNRWLVSALVALLVASPFLWYTASVSLSAVSIRVAGSLLTSGNLERSGQLTNVATYWTKQATAALSLVTIPLRIARQEKIIRGQERLVSLLSDLGEVQGSLVRIAQTGRSLAPTLLATLAESGEGSGAASALTEMQNDLSFAHNSLGLAQAQLAVLVSEKTFPFSIEAVWRLGQRALVKLSGYRGDIANLGNFFTLYPRMAGFQKKTTYLILFQNSMELRPTGGFIGSVALGTFEDGKLTDLSVQDVYSLDGQLKGHVDPPPVVRRHIGQEHWYLRDSNWDPDFPTSAATARWFYEKETGVVVDGVIAINVPFVQDLLAATGPVELTDYSDRITTENFFGKSLFYTQTDFFPGSTQKKDFLGSLARALTKKVSSEKGISPTALFLAVTQALDGHDILFYFQDEELQLLVERMGWAGRLPEVAGSNQLGGTCASGESRELPCLSSYFALIDANVGVNKVNYFIRRDTTRQITFGEDGSVGETIAVLYTNTSTDQGASGGGKYVNAARFYLPNDADISEVTLDGTALSVVSPEDKTKRELPYAERLRDTPESTILLVAFTVQPASERRIVLSYTRKAPLVLGDAGAVFELIEQKQPGLMHATTQMIVSYPIFWLATDETPADHNNSGVGNPQILQGHLAKSGQLTYNSTLLRDTLLRIRFTK